MVDRVIKWLRLFSWFLKRNLICTFFIWLFCFFRFFVLFSVFRMWVISQLSTCVPLSKRSMKSSTGEVISTRVVPLAHNAEKNFRFSCWVSAVNTIEIFLEDFTGKKRLVPRGEKCFCSWPPTWPPWRHVQTSNIPVICLYKKDCLKLTEFTLAGWSS